MNERAVLLSLQRRLLRSQPRCASDHMMSLGRDFKLGNDFKNPASNNLDE